MSVSQQICYCALLSAFCVVLAFAAKGIFGQGPLRFTVESIPIFFGAFYFSPFAGAAIALTADLLSCVLTGMAPLPLVSLGAVLVGLVSGVMHRYILKKAKQPLRITVSVFSGHIVGSMLVKSLALYPFYNVTVFWRIPIYIGIAVIESAVIVLLMKKQAIARQIEEIKHK